jgi:hypothetical protein
MRPHVRIYCPSMLFFLFLTDSLGTAEANTRLSAILWKESGADSKILDGWHFEHTSGSARQTIGFDMLVKDIQAEGGHPTLYLVPNPSRPASYFSPFLTSNSNAKDTRK